MYCFHCNQKINSDVLQSGKCSYCGASLPWLISRRKLLALAGQSCISITAASMILEACAQQPNPQPTPTPSQSVTRSQYAPYWYLDDLTDSIIEVKNNLASPLSLLPLITPLNGPTAKLNVITVAPFATVQLDLKTQPQLAHMQRGPRSGAGGMHWGDGSRPNSLLGSAQLIPISPTNANAGSFGAWILMKDPKERLGMVTTFESVTGVTNPRTQEGLWWLPFPDTKAYYSLQNASSVTVDLRIDFFGNAQTLATQYLTLEASTSKLIEIGEALGMDTPPPMGGIRVSVQSPPRIQSQLGFFIGRGRLIQENLGFASSLMLHDSLGDVATTRRSELHAPGAYFGQLDRLIDHARAFLHPHLLMRNTTDREITAEAIIYGRNANGQPTKFLLKPRKLTPRSVEHIDLQEERQASLWDLADGLAGLRLIHNGSPTDVVTELINVEEEGRFAYYDAVKSKPLHRLKMQAAVSFNMAAGHQSFLILKNTTDEPQEAQIILDYDDGKKHYEVRFLEVPAQQVSVVDLKGLRDTQTPDFHAQVLPLTPIAEFGGAAIFSKPGAFVFSDPTFTFVEPVNAETAAFADIVGPDQPPDRDVPFFAPSCGRGGDRTTTVPPPGISTVKVWLNAFIPRDIPGQTKPVPNNPGLTMISPNCALGCFLTDQRSFSSDIQAPYRMHSEVVIDVTGPGPSMTEWHDTGWTSGISCSTGASACSMKAPTTNMHFINLRGSASNLIQVDLQAAASNPCSSLAGAFGDIDYTGTITIDVRNRYVSFDGLIDKFPAYEMYATADDGAGRAMWIHDPDGNGPCLGLPGSANQVQRGSTRI